MTGILKLLQDKKLRSTIASIQYSERVEAIVHERAELTKRGLGSLSEEVCLAELYHRMKNEYYGKFTPIVSHDFSSRQLVFWRKVVTACHTSGASPEKYMRAQFAWFHKVFGTVPKPHQLATALAIQRAMDFSGITSHKIIGNDIRAVPDLAQTFRQSERLMGEIMKAQKISRIEVYQRLVLTGEILFDKNFLMADPVYQEALRKQQ